MSDTFFAEPERRTVDGRAVEWFIPSDHSRGPWDPDACHAGPPTGLLVRAMEQALPAVRLVRVTVDLTKPIPMAGFWIDTEVTRSGRTVGTTRAAIVDGEGVVRVTAAGLHLATERAPLFEATLDNSGIVTPRLADSVPGVFPVRSPFPHGLPGFSGARYGSAIPRVRPPTLARRRCG